jgi:transcriptional regulator with XRE-family HTH domain
MPIKTPERGGQDVIYIRRALGFYLRELRHKLDFSLRELEARCGISDSELLRIETGSQECGLESFIRICAAMGIPWGEVLDNTVQADFVAYREAVVASFVFQKMASKHEKQAVQLSFNVAMMAAFAAHLCRCSRPADRAKATVFPTAGIRAAFCRFSDRLDKNFTGRDRLSALTVERVSILSALLDDPVAELERHGLFNVELMKGLLECLTLIGSEGKPDHMGGGFLGMDTQPPCWTPFPSPATYFHG